MTKYYIIPVNDIVMEVEGNDKYEAMDEFAFKMDLDMNAYFRAVTEEEYAEIVATKMVDYSENMKINFWRDEFLSDPGYYGFKCEEAESAVDDVVEMAYEIYCQGDGHTEYEALELAAEEYLQNKQ